MEKQTKGKVKGITLMALVITVIVLLILSGIGVAMLSGDNGIINRSINAKESAVVKSEMRIVEVSSNSARGKNKYGLVEEQKLINELKITAGEGKTEVTPYDNGSHFLIKFLDTNRVYEVDNEEGVKYLGALNDFVNTGILTANPKRDKTPTREHRTIKISLKTINVIPDEDVEVYYAWVKNKTEEPEQLNRIVGFSGDNETDKTIKSGTVSTGELTDDGKWYLYVEARIEGGETVTEYFGDYVVGEQIIVADMGFVRYDYEKNGGSGCNRLSDQVEYGTTVALKGSGSNTATRTGGWDFVGWTTEEYGIVPMDSVEVNEQNNNITVYAIFKKNLTLKFYDATHGTNPVEKTITIYNKNTTGILSSSNVPAIGAYNGWITGYWTSSTSPNGSKATDDNGNIVASGATNYYAIYTKNVTVEYNLNGGTGTSITSATGTAKVNSSNLNVIEGASINLPETDATKLGHTFNGWNTKADGTGTHYNKKVVAKFNEGTTLYAEWGANSYNIKFDKNSESATGTMSNLEMVYGTGKQLTQNAYSRTGYTFESWNTKADGTGTRYTDKQSVNNLATTGTVTIYAQWTPNTYTVKFNANGGAGTMQNETMTYDTNKVLTINTFTRDGYIFEKWNTKADGTGTNYTDGQSVKNLATSGEITLYAQWKDTIKPTKPVITANYSSGNATYTSGSWANKMIYTTITSTDAGGIVTIQYSKDNKATWKTLTLGKSGGIKNTGNSYYGQENWTLSNGRNETLYFRVIDSSGNISDESDAFILKYDTAKPTITANNIDYGETLSIRLQDALSGVIAWQVNSSSTEPTSGWTTITSTTDTTVTKNGLTVGTYYIWAKDAAGNVISKEITVSKKTITAPTASNKTYTGLSQTGVAGGTGYTVTDGAKIDVGSYTAVATLSDKTNTTWNDGTTGDKNFNWTIAPKEITVTWGATESWLYDGNEHAPTVTSPVNGVNSEIINITVSGQQSNIGTNYTATATISSVTGGRAKKENYELKSNTKKFSITVGELSGGSVKITGINKWGETLTATVTDTNPVATYTYKWYSNDTNSTSGGTEISGATGRTYVVDKENVGKYIYVVVTASKENYTSKTFDDITDGAENTNATVAKQNLAVTRTNYNKAYDGAAHGVTVKVTSSNWNGKTIVSGTSTSYGESVTTNGAVNTTYTLKPTYTNYTTSKTVYFKVTGGDYYNDYEGTGTVAISKKALTSTQITAYSTVWTSGATTYTRSNVATGVGSEKITLTYTPYANTVGEYTYGASAGSGKFLLSQTNTNYSISGAGNFTITAAEITGSVTISGTTTWGQTLTATGSATVPSSGVTFSNYQWYVSDTNSTSSGTAISGATSSTYTIDKAYTGKYIYVKVKATATNYEDKTLTSAATAAIAKQNLAVTRTNYNKAYDGAAHGVTVKVTSSNWNGKTIVSGTSTSYGTTVQSNGAVNTTYTLSPTYTNYTTSKTVYFKVTGGDYYNDYEGTGTVAISKKALTNTQITEWSKNWVSGATTYTRNNVATGVGSETITLTYTPYTNAVGTYQYATSAGSGKFLLSQTNTNYSISSAGDFIINSNGIEGTVTISGTTTWGQTLTATPSTTEPSSGVTFSNYQWYVSDTNSTSSGTAISGATSSTYAIDKSMVGKYIYATVSASATNYTTTTIKSAATAAIAKQDLAVTRTNYNAAYDGAAHGVTVKVTSSNWNGKTIVSGTSTSYGESVTTNGAVNTTYTLKPTYTNYTTSKTVYFKVTGGDYYNDYEGTGTVAISKKALTSTQITAYSTVWTSGATTYTRSNVATGVGSEKVTLTYTPYANTVGEYTYGASAGSGKFLLSQTNTNYSISGAGNFTITAAEITASLTISGTNKVGQTLTATGSATVPSSGVTFSDYKWYYNTTNSTSGGTQITGATSNTYTIDSSMKGKYIYATAKAVATNYADKTLTSAATSQVYVTITYSKGTGVSSIGKTSENVTGSITLPTITASSGYTVDGWYNGNTKVGNAQASYTPTNNITLTAKTTVSTSNKVTITLKKDGSNSTALDGYSVKITTSSTSSSTTPSFTGTTINENTLDITGAMVPGTTYYIWVGKDANHKSTLTYSGVSFTGEAEATATLNFYTLTMIGTNVGSLKLNSTSVTSGNSVVVLGGTKHAITGTVTSGYVFSEWGKTSGTATFDSETTLSTKVTVNAASTINAAAVVNPNNKVTLTLKKDGSNATDLDGYKVYISTSNTNNTKTFNGTTTTESTLVITGAMSPATTYYVWIGKDENHKTADADMIYTGVSFTGGTSKTGTINFYTITIALNDTTMTFNETSILNDGTVVALKTNTAVHEIVATPAGGYAFNKWTSSSSSTTITSSTSTNTTLKVGAVTTLTVSSTQVFLKKSETSTSGTTAKFLYTTIERRKIKSITFADSIAGHTVDGTTCFDVSSVTDAAQVLLWITNTDENGYVEIVIGQNGGVKANPDSGYLFSYVGYNTPLTINFTNFDTSSATRMESMFNYCGYTAMTSLDLGDNFDTSNVTNMAGMFSSCGYTAMTSLDLGNEFDTNDVGNMISMFSSCGCTAMTSLDLGDKFDTSNVTNMNHMFDSCGYKAMASLNLGEKFDTSNVINMQYMFHQCGSGAMTSLDLGEKFDTSSVTDMSNMFVACGQTAMTSLDLGDKFDTSSVTDMSNMFSSCGQTAMTSLDLGDNFDTSSVTDMSNMFSNCGQIAMTSLDLGDKFDTSNVTNMHGMFNYCGYTAMTSLDLGDKFDTRNVTNMYGMFSSCGYTAMTSLDLGDNFDTSSVTDMRNMFSSCGQTAMTSLDLGDKFDTSNVTSMASMFSSCGKIAMTSLDLGDKFDTSNVTSMASMFALCSNLVTIYATESFVTTSVTNGANMFQYDAKLVGGMGTTYDSNHRDHAYAHLDLGTTNPGYFTDKRTYYVEFDANDGTGTMARQVMTYGESSNLTTNTFTRTGYIFAGWNTEADGSGTSYTDGQSVLNLEDGWKKVKILYAQWIEKRAVFKTGSEVNAKMKQLAGNSSATSSTEDTNITEVRRASSIPSQYMIDSNIVSTDSNDSTQPSNTPIYMWYDSGKIYYYTEDLRPETNANASYMFKYLSNVTTIEVEELDTENTTNMGYMFIMCQNLTSLDVSNFDTSEVTIMTSMFSNCKALTNLDVSGFDTSKVEYMDYMFQSCQVLTSINVSEFDTISVRKMERMFDNCKLLTSIDVSGFDTSNVEDMEAMFNNCIALTSIDVSGFDTSKVKRMGSMFGNCQVLTSIDVSGFVTSNVEYMNGMFSNCQALTNIDVSEFDTSKVTSMNYMFNGCESLTSIDVSGFDTSKVTSMNYMFNGCELLTSIDVSGFNTEKVTNMSYMFQYCEALTVLDISGFNTALVTDMSYMFNNCTNLKTIFADTGWTTAAVTTSGTQMFTGDTVLVGGFGTTYDSSKIDKTYARIDQGTTLPGYFTDIHTYYVEFDANGGTGTMDRQMMFYGTASNLTANAFKNSGYSFASWNTEPDGSGTSYTDGQSVLNLEDGQGKVKTLYAQWTEASYKLNRVIGASNILTNGGFENYTLIDAQTKTANGVTHTWDKALNGVPGNTSKSYNITDWGTGFNSGVAVPEIGYHAHMRIVNNNSVVRFKTNEAYAGQTGANVSGGTVTTGTISSNRWLGITEIIPSASIEAGATYVFTIDAYRVSGNNSLTGGLYYVTTSGGSVGFYSGKCNFVPSKTGEWETFSWTFTVNSDYDPTTAPRFFIYGYERGTGELYIDNARLEKVGNTSGNLMSGKQLQPYLRGGDTSSVSGGTYTLTKSHSVIGSGYYIPTELLMTGRKYRLSYTIQKTAGTFENIGGHSTEGNQSLFTIDGTASSAPYRTPGTNMSSYNNTSAHTIVFEFTYGKNGGLVGNDGKIYIQPNRSSSTNITVKISNVQLYDITEEITKTYNSTYTSGELDAFTRVGYVLEGWYADANYTDRISVGDTFNINSATFENINEANTPAYIYAKWEDSAKPVVTINRTNYNKFSWSATDNGTIAGYQITNSATEPSATGSGWTTSGTLTSGTYTIDVSSAKSYYVYVKDNDNNIGKASITSYMLTRSQGANSTLKTRADSSSSTTGTDLTANTAMLNGTPIWASATGSQGYTPTLKIGGVTKTPSGATATIGAATTVASTATVNTYTIVFNKNNSNASGTMANMSMTYGIAKNLTANAFAVTTAGITSKQVFNGWNTAANGSGTSFTDGQSVNNLTTTNGGTVNLYAQWINANYFVNSPVKYTTTLAQAVSAANTSATITVLQTNTDRSSVSIGKTLTLALNGKTLTRDKHILITAGKFTISGSGIVIMESAVSNQEVITGTGGTFATSGTPKLISNYITVYGTNMSVELGGGYITNTNSHNTMIINEWGTATITNTKILTQKGNAPGMTARSKNGKSLTINGSSAIANGCTKVTGTGDTTATALHWLSTGTLTITGEAMVTAGRYADNAIVTPAETINGIAYTGENSKIVISGNADVFSPAYALSTSCSSISINTSGFIASGKTYAIYNSKTASISISRARIIVKRTSAGNTVYNNGTGLNPTSDSLSSATFTDYTLNSSYVISSTTYSMSGLYVHRRGWQKLSDNYTYYYQANGTKKTGWLSLGENYYYLVPSANWNGSTRPVGSRLENGSFTINGTVRKFDANGVCTNPN